MRLNALMAIFCSLLATTLASEALDLVFVLEVSRHGHRSSFNEVGSMDPPLTQRGRSRTFSLGQKRRAHYVDELGFLGVKFYQKQIILASTDKERTFSTAREFFRGLYPLTPIDLPSEPRPLGAQLFNPLKKTAFERMLEPSRFLGTDTCPVSIIRRIPNAVSSFDLCEGLKTFFSKEGAQQVGAISHRLRETLPLELTIAEQQTSLLLNDTNLSEFFYKLDESISELYQSTDPHSEAVYPDLLKVSSFILARNFLNAGNKTQVFRELTWRPILDLLENIDTYVKEESPLTLKYLFVAMHDINLVHLLSSLGYYSDLDGAGSWKDVQGVDFNDSIRFEVYETRMLDYEDLDKAAQAFVRVYFNDLELPCPTKTKSGTCPLVSLLADLQTKISVVSSQIIAEECQP